MTIGAVNNAALLGIKRGFDKMNRDAATIASATSLSGSEGPAKEDVTRTLVSLQENNHYFQASARLFSAQNRMLGRLLNETA
ncbi:MAG: hypothetical protein HQL47_09180 [Gammaproteobacteria bacterium]|nr:hypothetical protein [Gammaproteobacteria bacterium]